MIQQPPCMGDRNSKKPEKTANNVLGMKAACRRCKTWNLFKWNSAKFWIKIYIIIEQRILYAQATEATISTNKKQKNQSETENKTHASNVVGRVSLYWWVKKKQIAANRNNLFHRSVRMKAAESCTNWMKECKNSVIISWRRWWFPHAKLSGGCF